MCSLLNKPRSRAVVQPALQPAGKPHGKVCRPLHGQRARCTFGAVKSWRERCNRLLRKSYTGVLTPATRCNAHAKICVPLKPRLGSQPCGDKNQKQRVFGNKFSRKTFDWSCVKTPSPKWPEMPRGGNCAVRSSRTSLRLNERIARFEKHIRPNSQNSRS